MKVNMKLYKWNTHITTHFTNFDYFISRYHRTHTINPKTIQDVFKSENIYIQQWHDNTFIIYYHPSLKEKQKSLFKESKL